MSLMSKSSDNISDEYIDILEERRNSSDLRFSLQEWNPSVSYQYGQESNQDAIFMQVLNSTRVQEAIAKTSTGKCRAEKETEVLHILKQMAHCLDVSMVRKFAFMLSKIGKQLYNKILVNKEGVDTLRSVAQDNKILLMPTHRSYADFLLISYFAFHFQLPLPVIAAGMDFISMAIIGDMLRHSGAFFIRRSFSDDALYWSVFQEYVQILVIQEPAPMEFFLEGTRSRSGKSLPPKIGLLGCAIDCWANLSLPDIMIVPISISYNRTLEEKLYAYEMLGIPKPKESTSGLLKAMNILKENYGNIYIHIGDPISVRKFLEPTIDRSLYTNTKGNCNSNSQLMNECERLGLHILRKLQKNTVISIWSLICFTLIKSKWRSCDFISLALLEAEVNELKVLCEKVGTKIDKDDNVKKSLQVHNGTVFTDNNENVHILDFYIPGSKNTKIDLSEDVVSNAVTHLLLQHYCNQFVHILVRPALVMLLLHSSLQRNQTISLTALQEKFNILLNIFKYEFIFEKNDSSQDFMDGISICTWSKEYGIVHNGVYKMKESTQITQLLLDVIKPFVITYSACASVIRSRQYWLNDSTLIEGVQNEIQNLAKTNKVYSALSLDSIKTAIRSFKHMNALTKLQSDHEIRWMSNHALLGTILNVLSTNCDDEIASKL